MTKLVRAGDGTSLAVRSWPGEEPGILYVHGTGFSKELWEPVVEAVRGRGHDPAGWAVDQRGHGDSGEMGIPMDWEVIGSDVADVLDDLVGSPAVGVGHSSGGAALAMAAIDGPGAFRHLVLIEPIIMPPPHERRDSDPMGAAAEARRSSFPNRDAAIAHFRSKRLFAGWEEGAVAAYVEGALRATGSELVLKCTPRTEAEHYRSGWSHSTWDRLGEIATPVTLVVGADSTTHQGAYLAELTERFINVDLVVVPQASHSVPMEQPDAVADAIEHAGGSG